MTKIERIKSKIENEKWLVKNIYKMTYFDIDDFIRTGMTYIKAIKEGRMINSIGSVSSSGMSRTIKFMSTEKSKTGGMEYFHRNYWAFFKALGYTEARSKDGYFSIGGCGMDMIFDTNYRNIHYLHRWGFISRKQCDRLAQMTPNTI